MTFLKKTRFTLDEHFLFSKSFLLAVLWFFIYRIIKLFWNCKLCMFFISKFCTMEKTRTFHFPHSTEIECVIFFRSWRDIFYNMQEMSYILFPYYQYIAEVIYMFFSLFLFKYLTQVGCFCRLWWKLFFQKKKKKSKLKLKLNMWNPFTSSRI